MSRAPAGKLKLWIGQPVNAPFVTPPMSLRVVLILCILSVAGSLAYAVFVQLGHTGFDRGSILDNALLVACFLLPILIAVTISTNRAISRPIILTFALVVAYQVLTGLEHMSISREQRAVSIVSVALVIAGTAWWLFGSSRLRLYYALVAHLPIPEDLKPAIDKLTHPGRFEAGIAVIGRLLAPYLEIAVGVIIIGALIYAIGLTGSWW